MILYLKHSNQVIKYMRGNLKTVLAVVLMLFASLQCSFAQELGDSTQNSKYWNFRSKLDKYFGIQASYMNLSNLNELLQANGYPEISKFQFGLGLGLGYDLGSVLLGVDLEASINFSDKAKVRTGRTALFVSTNKIKAGEVIVSPFVSFGLQSTDARIRIKEEGAKVEGLLQSDRGNVIEMEHFSPVVDFGLALKKRNSKGWTNHFMRVGYRLGLENAKWKLGGSNADGSVADRINSAYLQWSF